MIADRETLYFPPAPLRLRLGANLLDGAVVALNALLLSGIDNVLDKVSDGLAIAVAAAGSIWAILLFIVWIVLAGKGQSTGKLIMGLQVVGAKGSTIGVLRMWLRSAVKGIVLILVVLDPILVLSDAQRRRSMADRVMGTQVVEIANSPASA